MLGLKSLVFLLFVFCIFPSIFTSAQAQSVPTQTVFPAEQFMQTGGRDLFTRTLSVPEFVASSFTVRVINGTPAGAARLATGRVLINGVEIIHAGDFGLGVSLIERTATLPSPSRNTVTVDLTLDSVPGSFATVTILGTAPTTLQGRVLDIQDNPLAGVPVRIGSASAVTDDRGFQ